MAVCVTFQFKIDNLFLIRYIKSMYKNLFFLKKLIVKLHCCFLSADGLGSALLVGMWGGRRRRRKGFSKMARFERFSAGLFNPRQFNPAWFNPGLALT